MKRFCLILLLICGCVSPVVIRPDTTPTLDISGVVCIKTFAPDGQGHATGFVVAHKDGWWYAATAGHAAIFVMTVDGKTATPVSLNMEQDVGLVRFRSVLPYHIYPLARAAVGQEVWAVGYPGVPRKPPIQFVHHGRITAVDGMTVWVSAGLAPGFSGGPILDDTGSAVGVTYGLAVISGNFYESLGAATSTKAVETMLARLK